MKKGIITFICIILVSQLGYSQAPDKMADIRTFLELTGGFSVGDQIVEALTPQIIDLLKKSKNKPTEKTIATVKTEMKNITHNAVYDKGGLVEKLCQIYGNYYTHDDIKKLITFYRSDVGKKTTKIMPLLLKESSTFGQEWSNNIIPIIINQLRTNLNKKGITIPEI